MFRTKPLSDAEYVEKVRKRDHTQRRMWWVWPLLLLAMFYCLVQWGDLSQRLIAGFPGEKKMIYTGIFLGGTYGFMFSMMALQAGFCLKGWIDARHGFRTERLMLKYYDELKANESPDQQVHRTP